jgi:FkbM family methyltransferase
LEDKGSFHEDRLQLALTFVKNWALCVSVGAHVGTWTVPLAARFGEVLAFEPVPEHFECLKKNVHGLDNVKLFQCGLSSRNQKANWANDPTRPGNTGSRYLKLNGGDIFLHPLDELRLDNVGFLKIDTEGCEPLVIEGAKGTIKRCRPTVLVEVKKGFEKRYGLETRRALLQLEEMGARAVGSIGSDHVLVFDD